MDRDLAIAASGLTKIYRSRWQRREVRAVEDLSLSVRTGTTYGLLGPNGAGKTTFVKMLLSAVHPTSGRALLFGRDASMPEARRPIGYLPENHRFPTYFTGYGMLDFYAALSGVNAVDRARRIPELLATVGLEDWGAIRIGKYSKGMLQRLGLAQAIIHKPRLLILDEPSDGVDPVGRRQIRDILRRLESEGVTIFINSHLLQEVEMFCHEVAILRRGKLVLTGRVDELTQGKGYRLVTTDGATSIHPDVAAANAAIDQLRAAGREIQSLAAAHSTLEEVFVEAVGGASEERPESRPAQ